MLEQLEITFCKNADAFAGFHSSDDGFHSGVAKKVWSYFCTGKQFHAKLVDGCIGWHEKKRLTGDFFYGFVFPGETDPILEVQSNPFQDLLLPETDIAAPPPLC